MYSKVLNLVCVQILANFMGVYWNMYSSKVLNLVCVQILVNFMGVYVQFSTKSILRTNPCQFHGGIPVYVQ